MSSCPLGPNVSTDREKYPIGNFEPSNAEEKHPAETRVDLNSQLTRYPLPGPMQQLKVQLRYKHFNSRTNLTRAEGHKQAYYTRYGLVRIAALRRVTLRSIEITVPNPALVAQS